MMAFLYGRPKTKIARRLGVRLPLKGERSLSAKDPFLKRPYPPGQHGQKRVKLSDYGVRLHEKQKLKATYGLRERQFRNLVRESQTKSGLAEEFLLATLERRLDNVVYRLGLAPSRGAARQLVNHRHISVNGKVINIPSWRVSTADKIGVVGVAPQVFDLIERPGWLTIDKSKKGKVVRLPVRQDLPQDIEVARIFEFYTR